MTHQTLTFANRLVTTNTRIVNLGKGNFEVRRGETLIDTAGSLAEAIVKAHKAMGQEVTL